MTIRVIHRLHESANQVRLTDDRQQLVLATREAVAEHLSSDGRQFDPSDVEVLIEYYSDESSTESFIHTTIEGLPVMDPDGRPVDLCMQNIDERLDNIGSQIISMYPVFSALAIILGKTKVMDISYTVVAERLRRSINHQL